MVAWYKHDIPAWMDGTASLSSDAYRAYHIICQMLYLAEEPILLNERYLAGACNISVRAFRSALSELLDAKKLTVENGKVSNARVAAEIFRVEKNRENARKGGEKSGEVRQPPKKENEINDNGEATLPFGRSLIDETRRDSTKERKDAGANAPIDLKKQFWDRAREILGTSDSARSLIGRMAKAYGEDWAKARAALETASTKINPRAYISGICNNQNGARRTGDEYVII